MIITLLRSKAESTADESEPSRQGCHQCAEIIEALKTQWTPGCRIAWNSAVHYGAVLQLCKVNHVAIIK